VRRITSLDQVTTYPLCWPPNKPRAAARKAAPFRIDSLAKAQREIDEEMRHWRAMRWLVSMAPGYIKGPTDPGAAVWFELESGKPVRELRVLACDQYMRPVDNLHAISLTLNALRAIDRWGAYSLEQAMEGAKLALPPPPGAAPARPWWDVLEVGQDWPIEAIEQIARVRAAKHHPDTGGSTEAFQEFSEALDAARAEKAS
jgi:hypothetical protein